MKTIFSLVIVIVLLVSAAFISPAFAVNYAQINSVVISGHDVNINASGPCPAIFPVQTVITSTKIKITVTTETNPLAGVCAPDAPLDNTDITVHVDLQKNKQVWVNGIYQGIMYK